MKVRVASSYEAWRRTIPFTNAQVVAAIRAEAAAQPNAFMAARWAFKADYLERTGRLSSRTLASALGRLITVCACCGKKALYRQGVTGRCREHRLVPDAHVTARQERIEMFESEKRVALNEADRERRGFMGHHAARGKGKRRIA